MTRSSAKSMPFTPRLTITGPVDAVTPDKADNVVAVVSEGLSNAIRHSGADAISVSVAVIKRPGHRGHHGQRLRASTTAEKRNGLANLEDRARMLDGECTITTAPDAGTSVEWSVPALSRGDAGVVASRPAGRPVQRSRMLCLPAGVRPLQPLAGVPGAGGRAGDEDRRLGAALEAQFGQQG